MFTDYIKGIIFFLVFASFVGIILPESKYKSYINIVLGFITMFMVFEPVAGLIRDDTIGRISAQLSMEGELYEERYNELIADTFKQQMREQMSRAMESLGYRLLELEADIEVSTGELGSVTIIISEEASGIPAVNITNAQPQGAEDVKKIVSDFYQLGEEHIYVTIQ